MKQKRKEELISIYKNGLLTDTIPFWQKHSVDHKYGGFTTYLNADGSIVSTDKPMWVIGRITWLFAKLYNNVEPKQEWLELAKHGIDFIRKYGFDKDGRMFYAVTRDGQPLRKRRYLFTETFGVMALAEYSKACDDEQTWEEAVELYRLIIRYHTTPGQLEPKSIQATQQLKSHAMPMILLAISQTLRQINNIKEISKVINESIYEIKHHFLKPQFKALLEVVGPNGEYLDEPSGRVVNPGHAIETAWFIMEEGRFKNDKSLIELGTQILDWSLQIGWDNKYGGIYYFRDVKGLPCDQYEHDMKLWWPHNESIYATLLAYHLTGETKYADWHQKIHDWSYSHFPDKENGEWFGYLHRDGSLSCKLKGNMWKGPFHLPRMQLNCWKLLEQMKTDK